jgi:Flp pilus assembly protein TadD
MLVLLAITAAAFLSRKRAPYIWWGWLWYAITLAPAASFIQVGGHGIADRYTYIPLVGIFVALAWAGADAAERLGKRGKMVAGGAAATALMTLVLVCTVQVGYWRDSITLLTHAIAVTKDNKVAHYNLGSAYLEAGDNKNAAKEYEEVLKIEPDNLIAITNMGVAYAGMGKRDEAERIYYVALTLKPDDVSTLVNLAAALTDEGNLDQAIMHLTDAIAYEPENVTAHFNMAFTLMKKGDREAACRELSIVLQLQPNHPRAAKLHQDYCILKKESTAPPDTGGPAWQK